MQERLDSLCFEPSAVAVSTPSAPGLDAAQGKVFVAPPLFHKSLSLQKSENETFRDRCLVSPFLFIHCGIFQEVKEGNRTQHHIV
jgi:hypothetical protein